MLSTPKTENFASGASDLMLHNGNSTKAETATIVEDRLAINFGRPNGETSIARQSPNIIENAMQDMADFAKHANAGRNLVRGPTVLDQAP